MTTLLCSGQNTQHFPEQSLVQDDLISLPSGLKKKEGGGSTFRRYIRKVQQNRVGSKVAKITNFLLVIFSADFSMATSLFKSGMCVCAKSLQLCLTLCDPMDCSLPGSSVHGILQARLLEWVAMPASRGSSQPRDRTCISCSTGGFFTAEPSGKPKERNTRLYNTSI